MGGAKGGGKKGGGKGASFFRPGPAGPVIADGIRRIRGEPLKVYPDDLQVEEGSGFSLRQLKEKESGNNNINGTSMGDGLTNTFNSMASGSGPNINMGHDDMISSGSNTTILKDFLTGQEFPLHQVKNTTQLTYFEKASEFNQKCQVYYNRKERVRKIRSGIQIYGNLPKSVSVVKKTGHKNIKKANGAHYFSDMKLHKLMVDPLYYPAELVQPPASTQRKLLAQKELTEKTDKNNNNNNEDDDDYDDNNNSDNENDDDDNEDSKSGNGGLDSDLEPESEEENLGEEDYAVNFVDDDANDFGERDDEGGGNAYED